MIAGYFAMSAAYRVPNATSALAAGRLQWF